MADLNGMSESMFRQLAINSVMKYWNSDEDLVSAYGRITNNDIYVTWQCKAIENFKALLGVNRDGDGMYFEFTLHGAKKQCYLDIYRKNGQVVVPIDRYL